MMYYDYYEVIFLKNNKTMCLYFSYISEILGLDEGLASAKNKSLLS